jgi:hypothetical protein
MNKYVEDSVPVKMPIKPLSDFSYKGAGLYANQIMDHFTAQQKIGVFKHSGELKIDELGLTTCGGSDGNFINRQMFT